MSEYRSHGAAAEPPPLSSRLRTLVAYDSPLPRPKRRRVDPVRRSWLGAFWQTRIAVRAGMPLDEFLRSRLARYVSGLPVPSARLPLDISVVEGDVVVRDGAPPAAPPPANDPDGWLAPLVAAEGPAVREEAAQLDVRLAMLDGEIEAARRRVEDVSKRFAADVAAGLVAAPPAVEATAEQMGRPSVRNAAARNVALGFSAAALGAEAWQVALPLLTGAAIDPAALGAEAARRPGEVVALSVFAIGVAVALFGLAHAGLTSAAAVAAGDADARRQRWRSIAAAGATALAALIAVAVAELPRPTAVDQAPRPALALLLFAVPVAAALALRFARHEEDARVSERVAALGWDRDRALALAERGRRLEELSWAEDEQRDLERQRDAARRRLRELNLRALAAARIAAEAADRERAALARLAQGLVAALELDRYEYVRQATARGMPELVAPRRRRPEPRAEAPAPPAPPAAAEVEASRLAS